VEWRVSGPNALNNGHVEVYGRSGYGKTQFVKSLLVQLRGAGSHFSVCDFKDDYGVDDYGTDFPAAVGAQFFELYEAPVPFNPMAGHNVSKREMQSFCIELRDMVDIAAKQYVRMGPRQLGKLLHALEEAFEYARVNGRSDPLLEDIGNLIDDDLAGILGDLFRFEFFGKGPPFGELVNQDSIFSFAKVPGRGLTEDLLAGFILSSFYLRMQAASAVHSTVRFAVVVDEAHRVAGYKAVKSMVSEQRSKGVAVILATQKPGQLPPEVETNAQTKVFLNLPGQDSKEAAKRLDSDDRDLPDLIRNLKPGEAFVSLGGPPFLVNLRQYWRDDHVGPPEK
jgi:DNA helicase HerA-like ATPase